MKIPKPQKITYADILETTARNLSIETARGAENSMTDKEFTRRLESFITGMYFIAKQLRKKNVN